MSTYLYFSELFKTSRMSETFSPNSSIFPGESLLKFLRTALVFQEHYSLRTTILDILPRRRPQISGSFPYYLPMVEFSFWLNFNLMKLLRTSWNNITTSVGTAWKVSKYGVFFGPYFSGPYGEILCIQRNIQSECWKIRTRKNSVFWHISHSESVN